LSNLSVCVEYIKGKVRRKSAYFVKGPVRYPPNSADGEREDVFSFTIVTKIAM